MALFPLLGGPDTDKSWVPMYARRGGAPKQDVCRFVLIKTRVLCLGCRLCRQKRTGGKIKTAAATRPAIIILSEVNFRMESLQLSGSDVFNSSTVMPNITVDKNAHFSFLSCSNQ